MDSKEFVRSIYETASEDVVYSYRTMFPLSKLDGSESEEWRSIHYFVNSLSESEKKILEKLMKNVSVDTLTRAMGVLDGSVVMEEYYEEFELTYDGGGDLTGSLRDILVELDSE